MDSNVGLLDAESKEIDKPSYQVRPSLSDSFKVSKVKIVIQMILNDMLQGKTYNLEESRKLTKQIADSVSAAVKDIHMKRYKHIVQVVLGQHLGSGCNYLARCRWDAECDNYTSEVFSNSSLFCVCTVFGVYLY